MKTVGLRELKNRLSRYVRSVRSGESWAITDRGTVIAELVPPSQTDDAAAIRADLVRRGHLVPASDKGTRKLLGGRRRAVLSGLSAQALLDESRGSR
jgi:prevent-host-death family protein